MAVLKKINTIKTGYFSNVIDHILLKDISQIKVAEKKGVERVNIIDNVKMWS